MANALEIVVKAVDKASPALRDVHKSVEEIDRAAKDVEKSTFSMGQAVKTALTGIAAAGAAAVATITALSAAAIKLAVDAAPLQSIEAAFEGITGAGGGMLRMLREASLGMVSNRDLMLNYNLAAQLVSKTFADQLPDAMKYLTKVSASTGQSMDYLMNSLVRGVGRMSPLILDNLAIQVSLEEATARAVKTTGKQEEALSKAEIQAGMMAVVMEKLAINTAKMPQVAGTASQGLASLSTWFRNLKDDVGTAFLPALQSLLDTFNTLAPLISDLVLPAIQSLAGWVARITEEWTHGFADLIARAANWGANIVESLAGGIMGSDAIARALRHVANSITAWLAPGSPPKLLPDLTEWGQGAVEAWLDGWTVSASKASRFLRNLRGNLTPFLEKIDLGEAIDVARLRAVFGGDAPEVERYLAAYRDVGIAVDKVAQAKEALAKAEEGGDEAAIATAKEQFGAAQKEEYDAKRRFYAQERRLEKRVSAEVQLARAIVERSKIETKAADNAARLAAEAEQRAIEQAHLQYRLAVAGTPEAQIAIWEEELAKVAEGTARFWQIKTRIVELERAAQKGGGEIASALGEGLGAGLEEEIDKRFHDSGAYMEQGVAKIDWRGIGASMAAGLWDGFMNYLATVPPQLLAWSLEFEAWTESSEVVTVVSGLGESIGRWLAGGLRWFLGLDGTAADAGSEIEEMLEQAVRNVGESVFKLGVILGRAMFEGYVEGMTGAGTQRHVEEAIEKATQHEPNWFERFMGRYGEWYGGLPDWLTGGSGGLPGYARGTSHYPGGWGIAGEQGPELIRLPRGSEILPADMTQRAVGNGMIFEAGAIIINAPGGDPRQVEIGVLRGLRAAGVMP